MIVPGAPRHEVVAVPGEDAVRARVAVDHVRAVAGEDVVVAGTAEYDVATRPGIDEVVARPGPDHVRPVAGQDVVVARKAEDRIAAGRADQDVVGGRAGDEMRIGRGRGRRHPAAGLLPAGRAGARLASVTAVVVMAARTFRPSGTRPRRAAAPGMDATAVPAGQVVPVDGGIGAVPGCAVPPRGPAGGACSCAAAGG